MPRKRKGLAECAAQICLSEMKQIGHLKLNGKRFQHRHSRAVERLKKFLRDLPSDEVKDVAGLNVEGFSNATVYRVQAELLETGLAIRKDHRVYYGSEKAIAEVASFPVSH